MDLRHGGRAVHSKDSFVYDLLTEFKRGRDAYLAGADDACAALRNKCYSSAEKKRSGASGEFHRSSSSSGGYGYGREEFGQRVNF